jgi:hypothetical protein
MPPKKRPRIGRQSTSANISKQKRQNKTVEERIQRTESNSLRTASARETETEEERIQRTKSNSLRMASARATETEQEMCVCPLCKSAVLNLPTPK